MLSPTSPMRFRLEGRHLELELARGRDIRHLAELDEVLWVALSSPATGLEFDPRTLQLIDLDSDGRIRSKEVRETAAWLEEVLQDLSVLENNEAAVPLDALRSDTESGAAVALAARRILANLGKPEADHISLSDLGDRSRIRSSAAANGDGVIDAGATEDPRIAAAIEAILRITGGERDVSGTQGIGAKSVSRFYEELYRFRLWEEEESSLSEAERELLLPFGKNTASAYRIFESVESALDQFFALSQLVAYDNAVAPALRPKPEILISNLDAGGKVADRAAVIPAIPNAQGILPLGDGVHPAWRSAIEELRLKVIRPRLGDELDSLNQANWQAVKTCFRPFRERSRKRPKLPFESLSDEEVQILNDPAVREAVTEYIEADLAVGRELTAVDQVERLLHLTRDFLPFCNNFVSIPHFYDPEQRAIFQAGELLIDGRRICLCVWVDHLDQHAKIAQRSGIFTVYCEVRSANHPTPRLVAAAVTAGTAGRIDLGKNGIFYDRDGNDYEARVVRILAHPISLYEAIFAPFRKLGRLLSSQIEKLADNREQEMQQSVTSGFSEIDRSAGSAVAGASQRARHTPAAETEPPHTPARSFGIGGLLAGGGFAIAAVGSSFAIVAERLKTVGTSGILYTVLVILLFLLIPSLIVAIIKLRGRDLGDVLEASGWAINGAIRLNFSLSRRLTRRGVYPVSAIRPRAPGRRRTILLGILALLGILYALGVKSLGWF